MEATADRLDWDLKITLIVNETSTQAGLAPNIDQLHSGVQTARNLHIECSVLFSLIQLQLPSKKSSLMQYALFFVLHDI